MNILGTAVKGIKGQTNLIGAPSFSTTNPYGLYNHFKSDQYASHYPNVRPITNELMGIIPHVIDSNGKPVSHPALDALFHPNRTDSLPLFMEKLGVSVLANNYTYLLVWRNEAGKAEPGGPFGIKGKNIAGYTFLEHPSVEYRDKRLYYKMGSQEFDEDEVIAIPGGARPSDLYRGYSPALAAAKWATLDGHIADFQNGFFENNAIPAGVFQVVAPTVQEYKDMVKTLQERHRGAGNNNNVSYAHVPLDAAGAPQQAQITWVPFANTNKEIDFKPLLQHVDDRLSESYGVSGIIKGVDSQATYNNAEVSEAGFAKRAVKPLAIRIYSQLTHELNRITGGLGVAFTFKYEIPAVSDAEKVKAETKSIEANMIRLMTLEGYSLDTVVNAFQLSESYKLLRKDNTTPVIDNDKPEVDEGNETDGSPDRTEIDGVTPLAKIKVELSTEKKLEKISADYMIRQVNRAIKEFKETSETPLAVKMEVQPEPTDDELNDFTAEMFAVIVGILLMFGEDGYETGVGVAGLDIAELQGFTLTETAKDSYRGYLRQVGQSYGNDTASSIQKVLADADSLGYSRKETEDALRDILDTDEYRVKRLARTELNNSQNIGKLEGIKSLEAEIGGTWEKTIDHSGVAPCPLCASQEGIWTAISQPLWDIGDSISTVNDKGEQVIYVNDWQSNQANDYHPNGRGALVFRRTA